MTTTGRDENLERFEKHRGHLWAVSYRMLGVPSDADDAVQETWLRLSRVDATGIDNFGGWLTTVVGRICLDMLRARETRKETALPVDEDRVSAIASPEGNPEQQAVTGDAVERALLLVLETLSPPERLAFVLHDMFAVPFRTIGPIVGKSTLATRQLASRARRRVQAAQGDDANVPAHRATNQEVVREFLEATRQGDFARLLTLLDPEVVLRADGVAEAMGASAETLGAHDVAEFLSGRARAARLAWINGEPGAVWFSGHDPQVAFVFSVEDGKVVGIDLVADANRLQAMSIEPLKRDPSASW